ncbi:MAG: ADP-ribosyltransferase [Patescibacteria group bacterium]|jgi:hypothetical protein
MIYIKLEKGKALPEGTVQNWKGIDYKKTGGKWLKVKKGKKASIVKSPANLIVQKGKMGSDQKMFLEDYKTSGYRALNEYLYFNKEVDPATEKVFKYQIKKIDSAFKKGVLKEDTIVYRGIRVSNIENMDIGLIGKVLKSGGYASTSISEHMASMFTGYKDSAVLKLKAKKGMNVINMDQFEIGSSKGEGEILFKREHKIKITNIIKTEFKFIIEGEIYYEE